MSLVVAIQGANGSGKTTLVRGLLEKFGVEEEYTDNKGKVWAYKLKCKQPLYVIGRYEKAACGGCDSFKDFAKFIPKAVRTLASRGNVIFESVCWSTMPGRSIELVKKLPQHHFIFCLLNPPWEVVVHRVQKRRLDKGNLKPLDPEKSIRGKYDYIPKTHARFAKEGLDARVLPWQNPLPNLLFMLENLGAIPPEGDYQ